MIFNSKKAGIALIIKIKIKMLIIIVSNRRKVKEILEIKYQKRNFMNFLISWRITEIKSN